ncbi:MAG: ornithine cyclodeaminase family protein [Actinobacteria bacterium]|nr:ornithine cyclodeaminase family protein [Actinomycetota bacterium]
MTLYLGADEVNALVTPELAIAAVRGAVASERAGETTLPARLDLDLPSGFMRLMPAALHDVMGAKLMTVVRGVGNRYLLLLFSRETGELDAILEASELTRLRTAAVTVVAGEMLCPQGAGRLGLIGSGFEAEGHLAAFAAAWELEEVLVYSPSRERRASFAERMSERLDLRVTPVDSAAAAVGEAPVAVLATKSSEPVIAGGEFCAAGTVLSIGSTRPDLRELDAGCFARAAVLLCDRTEQVRAESGDVIDAVAAGAIETERIVGMGEYDGTGRREDGRDLFVFKSVGTALQDLALAEAVLDAARQDGHGRSLGELAVLKDTSAPRGPGLSTAGTGA